MNTATKLTAFAAAIAAVFGVAAVVGAAVGPIDVDTSTATHSTHTTGDAASVPAPGDVATVDGYTVLMDGAPAVGDSELSFTVEFGGRVVQTEPYLGAAGHLVAIGSGDLAYLHVHPHEDDATSVVTFTGEFPTAGTYRLFFDFSHGGTVRTAAFTVTVGDRTLDPGVTMVTQEGH